MLYDRKENELALEALFSKQESKTSPKALSTSLTFLIHFSSRDVEILQKSVQDCFSLFLSPDWYSASNIAKEVGETGGNCLGDVLRKGLADSTTGAMIPVHGEDFFMCLRQSVFEAGLGNVHFSFLGRRSMHELAAVNFCDARASEDLSVSDLTSADFEWLFERSFVISQQRAVVAAYSDALFGPHIPTIFEQWRRDPAVYFPRYFHQVGVDFNVSGSENVEPLARMETEKRISNWFSDRLKAQTSAWNSTGWPIIEV